MSLADDKENAGSVFSYSFANTHINRLQLPICFIMFIETHVEMLFYANPLCYFSSLDKNILRNSNIWISWVNKNQYSDVTLEVHLKNICL